MNKNNLTTTLLVALVVGLLAFYGGALYQKGQQPSFKTGQFPSGMQRPDGQAIRNGTGIQTGRPVSGQIVSLEDNTLTVKTTDGSTKIVIFSDSTIVNKTTDGSKEDLVVGESVMVIGNLDTSGTLTAQTISVGGNFMSRLTPPQQPTD